MTFVFVFGIPILLSIHLVTIVCSMIQSVTLYYRFWNHKTVLRLYSRKKLSCLNVIGNVHTLCFDFQIVLKDANSMIRCETVSNQQKYNRNNTAGFVVWLKYYNCKIYTVVFSFLLFRKEMEKRFFGIEMGRGKG